MGISVDLDQAEHCDPDLDCFVNPICPTIQEFYAKCKANVLSDWF